MTMLRTTTAIALAAGLLAGCTNTGVPTTPDFTQARLVPLPPHLAPPTIAPAKPASMSGPQAVEAGARSVRITPNSNQIIGTTWIIPDVDHRAIYAIPMAPLAPTTLLFPMGEELTDAVSGSTRDFTISTAASGNRAAVTIMPNCASPQTKRFGPEADVMLDKCMADRVRATFITSAGPYSFEFSIYDYTSAQIVEINHAPPEPTNPQGTRGRPPFPAGEAQPLIVQPVGKWDPAWQPIRAWADAEKMVLVFEAPLPVLPGLWAGQEGESMVNYSVIETATNVYIVTHRRVTEAELRVDDQRVRITAPDAQQLVNQQQAGA